MRKPIKELKTSGKGIKPTLKQRKFVREYLKTGNGTRAALKAYDTDDPNVANQIAMGNLLKPTVQQLLECQAEKSANDICNIRDELAESKKDYAVRLNADKDILDRAGYKPPERNLNINVDYSRFYDERTNTQ